MRRKPRPPAPDPRPQWMIEQGARCGCKGTDDMCPCQNENPWPSPRIDWQARAEAAEGKLETAREALEFYANPDVYRPHPHGLGFDDRDLSWKAKAALSTLSDTKGSVEEEEEHGPSVAEIAVRPQTANSSTPSSTGKED